MINIGTKIANYYTIIAIVNGYALAENPKSPEPYVVWSIDSNGEGVSGGAYFTNRLNAELDLCEKAFGHLFDNESEAAEQIDNTLNSCRDYISEARNSITSASKLVDALCADMDALNAQRRSIP